MIWSTVPEIWSVTDWNWQSGSFFALSPPKNPKDQIIILHMCTKHYNHMIYGSWDMEWDGQFFVILGHFLPFYPTTTQKINILKKFKKRLEILPFYTSTPKTIIICYTGPEIWRVTDAFVIFHFGLFFDLLPH